MIYSFPQLKKESRFLTYGVVENSLKKAGHTVIPEITQDCDFVLYSLADVTDLRGLRQLRHHTSKKIIVGGHYAINFWSSVLYADYVWLGEIFDFTELNTVAEIEKSEHIYTSGDDISNKTVSTRIDWAYLPIVQIKKTSAYYLGGVGCKNNCKFCHTTWTHPHQRNSDENIKQAIAIAKKRKIHLTAVSNEYESDLDLIVRDMLGVDYISTPINSKGWVRTGIEFPTEETRKFMGKPLTRDDIFKILQKAAIEGVYLRLFHIGGYNNRDEWDKYINEMAMMLDRINYKQLLHLQFTNLQYQNYTPLYAERKSIDYRKYLTGDDTKSWYNTLRKCTKSVLVGRPSPFGHAAWRMGVELSTTRQQIDFWMSLYGKRLKANPLDMQNALFDSKVLDTPRYVFKRNTGRINRIND
jgi:pyruvate-formate lyase-activating enzyme